MKNRAIKSDSYLIEKFETGDRPTGQDFADLIESKAHKNEVLLKNNITSNEDMDKILASLFTEEEK